MGGVNGGELIRFVSPLSPPYRKACLLAQPPSVRPNPLSLPPSVPPHASVMAAKVQCSGTRQAAQSVPFARREVDDRGRTAHSDARCDPAAPDPIEDQ